MKGIPRERGFFMKEFIILTNILVKMISILYINCGGVMYVKTRLKELRARHNMNQTELAKKAKISRQTVSLIEREEYIPSLIIAKRLSKILGESIDDIFIFDEEEL